MKILAPDVRIEILRGNDRGIERRRTVADDVATTWIMASELAYGAGKSRAPERNNHTGHGVFSRPCRFWGLDLRSELEFGRWKAMLERAGMRVADADLTIAAIALAHGASVVTGNRRHCERIQDPRIEDWIRG